MDHAWFEDESNPNPQFDGSGKLYLIERTLSPALRGSCTEITDEVLRAFVLRDIERHGNFEEQRQSGSSEEQLVIVISLRNVPMYDGALLPFPSSQRTFELITKHLRVPSIFLQTVQRCTALHVIATSTSPFNENVDDEYISFIIQSTASTTFHFAASFSYSVKSRRAYVFLHGIRTPLMERFIRRVQGPNPIPLNTFWSIPSILIELYLQRTLDSLNEQHDNIFVIERATRVRWDSDRYASLEDIDLVKLTRDINFTTTHLAHQDMSFKTYRPMLEFLDECVKRYSALAVVNGDSKERVARVESTVLEKQDYLRSWIDGMHRRAEYLSQRGQALVETIYNLIAQKDNSLNRQMTRSSLQLTEAGQALANSSRDVAIAASRDGAVMRTIAAVTMFFLPATFTATFFSTSFFDFHVGRHERVYSWWIWLYFLVTVILTGMVLGCWFVMSNRKEKEITSKFGRGGKQRQE
ncbi:hypothetical protein BBP40_002346 [Aspergillus hancockii]|nr:hypothetical protein BBP40_002346 [Aspergillus hancockii]